jgi:hypothetical protein
VKQLTVAEFKSWFKGFIEGKQGNVLQDEDIARIQQVLDGVVEIAPAPIIINPAPQVIRMPIIPVQPEPVWPNPTRPWETPIWCGDRHNTGSPSIDQQPVITCGPLQTRITVQANTGHYSEHQLQ